MCIRDSNCNDTWMKAHKNCCCRCGCSITFLLCKSLLVIMTVGCCIFLPFASRMHLACSPSLHPQRPQHRLPTQITLMQWFFLKTKSVQPHMYSCEELRLLYRKASSRHCCSRNTAKTTSRSRQLPQQLQLAIAVVVGCADLDCMQDAFEMQTAKTNAKYNCHNYK